MEAARGPQGRTYAIPVNYSTVGLWVNDELFAQAGIKKIPTTWNELADAAAATTHGETVGLCIVPTWERMTLFALQQNGGLVSADGKHMMVLDGRTRYAVDWIVDLLKSGTAATPDALGASWCGDAFAKGKTAMAVEGAWMLPSMKQAPNVHWSVHELPVGSRKATLAYTGELGISSTSKNPDAAWLLLNYMASPDAQSELARAGLAVPAMEGVSFPEALRPFSEGIDYATVWSLPPGFFNSVLITADNEMSAVLEGEQSVSGMLDRIDEVGKQMLEESP
jgi:multiple sugar transport system substrate-binding protein